MGLESGKFGGEQSPRQSLRNRESLAGGMHPDRGIAGLSEGSIEVPMIREFQGLAMAETTGRPQHFRLGVVLEEHSLRKNQSYTDKKDEMAASVRNTFRAGETNIFLLEEIHTDLTQDELDGYVQTFNESVSRFGSFRKGMLYANSIRGGSPLGDEAVEAEFELFADGAYLTSGGRYKWAQMHALDDVRAEGIDIKIAVEPVYPFDKDDLPVTKKTSLTQFKEAEFVMQTNSVARDEAVAAYLVGLSETAATTQTDTNVLVMRGTMHYPLIEFLPPDFTTEVYIQPLLLDSAGYRLPAHMAENRPVSNDLWIAAYEEDTGHNYQEVAGMFGDGEVIYGDVRVALEERGVPAEMIGMFNALGVNSDYVAEVRGIYDMYQDADTSNLDSFYALDRLLGYDAYIIHRQWYPPELTQLEQKQTQAILSSVPAAYELKEGMIDALVKGDVEGEDAPEIPEILRDLLAKVDKDEVDIEAID